MGRLTLTTTAGITAMASSAATASSELPALASMASVPEVAATALPVTQSSLSWQQVPFDLRLKLLVLLAVVGGAGVSQAAVYFGHAAWVLPMGLTVVVACLWGLAGRWVRKPWVNLLACWRRIQSRRKPGALTQLPLSRTDEVGQVARAMYQLAVASIQTHYEAKSLRRTLDHRITEATRAATKQLHHMAMRDPLTELGNRRFLDQTLEPLVDSVLASGSTLTCVAVDCDHFKQVNDQLGHAVGDELLIFLASLIRGGIRPDDSALRLGGDEFVILMPGCDGDRVKQTTEQLRDLFRQHARMVLPAEVQVDLSIGVATLPSDGMTDGKALLARADDLLYAAKKAGKGRTMGV